MKGLAPLFLGIFGTFAFSWVGLTVLPNWQIGHLNPQSDEEGTDIYPQPQSGMFERGARVYAANGCIYCHSQQVRADYAADDIERGWGNRRSAPRDYIFERPVFLGKMRMGQDIANIGARAPAEQASPAPSGGAPPAASPSGGTSPAALSAPQGAVPVAASPAAKQSPSPSPATQAASPAPAGSPATASSPAPAAAASPVTSPDHLRPRERRLPVPRQVSLRRLRQQQRMQRRVARPPCHPERKAPARPGQFKQLVSHRCIPRRGIMSIFIRRAVSTSIRTCLLIVSSTKRAASLTHVQQTL